MIDQREKIAALRLLAVTAAALAGVLPSLHALPPSRASVIANIEMTDEGRKVPHPTPEHPAYYVPFTLGYSEKGELIAGEKPPARVEVLRQLGRNLAKEGYVLQALRPDAGTTLPSLILTFAWGSLNPQITDFGEDPDPTKPAGDGPAAHIIVDYNQREMATLVAGDSLARGVQFTDEEMRRMRDAGAEGRYFIIVSAYTFDPDPKAQKQLLWRARMSTERQGVNMDDVVPALVTSGAPLFGREVDRPKIFIAPLRGHVEVGAPTVIQPATPAGEKQSTTK